MNEEILGIWNDLNEALINFINQKVKNRDFSNDISQEVFIKVYSKIHSLKNQNKIIPWIYQITRNEINNHFRKQQFSAEISDLESSVSDVENLTAEFSKCILPMIDALPEKYKEAVTLSEIEGVSQKDLAVRLNISYSGAKSRVQRGREKLKDLLLACCAISYDKYGNINEYKGNSCSGNC